MNVRELSQSEDTSQNTLESDQGPAPYLVVGSAWCLLAMFAIAVRVPSRLWIPVFDWAFSQGVILEQAIPGIQKWSGRAVWLLAYTVLGLLAWFVIEKIRRRNPNHRWRRAILSWLVIQLVYAVVAAILVRKGIIAV